MQTGVSNKNAKKERKSLQFKHLHPDILTLVSGQLPCKTFEKDATLLHQGISQQRQLVILDK